MCLPGIVTDPGMSAATMTTTINADRERQAIEMAAMWKGLVRDRVTANLTAHVQTPDANFHLPLFQMLQQERTSTSSMREPRASTDLQPEEPTGITSLVRTNPQPIGDAAANRWGQAVDPVHKSCMFNMMLSRNGGTNETTSGGVVSGDACPEIN